jgi:CheY-like chemotaxis protein
MSCSDESHAREILPKVDAEFALAIIDDGTWPLTPSERDWLHLRWPDLPIVVLTNPEQGLEHRIDELGLADVLLKPFDVTELVQLAERIVYAPVRAHHLCEPARGAA